MDGNVAQELINLLNSEEGVHALAMAVATKPVEAGIEIRISGSGIKMMLLIDMDAFGDTGSLGFVIEQIPAVVFKSLTQMMEDADGKED